jgi:hypothetical protein
MKDLAAGLREELEVIMIQHPGIYANLTMA